MSVPTISARKVRELLAGSLKKFVIFDVRDYDFTGGHLRGAVNIPLNTFVNAVDDLVTQYQPYDYVIFHCMLSQSRGPSAASIFQKRLDALYGNEADNVRVRVLSGGFQGWIATYGSEFVEDFDSNTWSQSL